MTMTTSPEPTRRDFLYLATGAMAAAGGAATIWPFVSQMSPDRSTIAAGAPIEVDLTAIPEGQVVTLKWRGAPIFVRNRSEAEIAESKKVDVKSLPDPEADSARVDKFEGKAQEKWIVVYGACTHLGCIPTKNAGDYGGWYCPCHGSQYDNAGRIRKGPAPKNLALAPVTFLSANKIRIG